MLIVIAQVESYPKQPNENSRVIADDEMISMLEPFSGAFIAGGNTTSQHSGMERYYGSD